MKLGIRNKIPKMILIVKVIILSILYRNRKYLLCTPIHGNLGDQALLYAEESFFKNNLPKIKIIEVESSLVRHFSKYLKILVGKKDIYIHAGGFLGNLWLHEENAFREVLKNFTYNKIIVFPQTIFFTDDEDGRIEYQKSKIIYEAHPNLHFFLREKYSYDFMKENFQKCDIHLMPDMALYIDSSDFDIIENSHKCDALMCLRKDKERIDNNYNDVIKDLKQVGLNRIEYTDTVIKKHIYGFNRKKELSKIISEFYNAKIVITDRLHGMIFALIAGTPCLVFQNKSYKISGVYKWIRKIKSIKLHDCDKVFIEEIQEVIANKQDYNSDILNENYIEIIKIGELSCQNPE